MRLRSSSSFEFSLLCAALLVTLPAVGIRVLHVPVVRDVAGAVLSTVIVVLAWRVSRPAPDAVPAPPAVLLRVGGALLVAPFALVALLWVGLGTPWDSDARENVMRYGVLLAGAVAVTAGITVLREAFHLVGERVYPALALALGTLSGAAYVVWTAFQMGFHASVVANGRASVALTELNNVLDALLFAAGALAYAATAALAWALARAGWLRRGGGLAYVLLNLLVLGLLMLRGVSFPVPGGPTPWYEQPGFIVGIPAMPWVMPYLLGAVALRRAGGSMPGVR